MSNIDKKIQRGVANAFRQFAGISTQVTFQPTYTDQDEQKLEPVTNQAIIIERKQERSDDGSVMSSMDLVVKYTNRADFGIAIGDTVTFNKAKKVTKSALIKQFYGGFCMVSPSIPTDTVMTVQTAPKRIRVPGNGWSIEVGDELYVHEIIDQADAGLANTTVHYIAPTAFPTLLEYPVDGNLKDFVSDLPFTSGFTVTYEVEEDTNEEWFIDSVNEIDPAGVLQLTLIERGAK